MPILTDDKEERKMQIKMRKIELQIQELDDELIMYMIQRAEYELNRRYEKRLKGKYGKS